MGRSRDSRDSSPFKGEAGRGMGYLSDVGWIKRSPEPRGVQGEADPPLDWQTS
jgi:hypothetical protein